MTAATTAHPPDPISPHTLALAHRLRLATAIADRSVVALVECEGIRVGGTGERVYDTRAMLDERECSPQCIDLNRQELEYGTLRGLLVADDPAQPHLLRIRPNANTAP